MPMSPYLRNVRKKVGHDLLLTPSVSIITFDEQDRVLLVKHIEGQWAIPVNERVLGRTHLSSEVGYLSSEVGHLSSEVGNFLLGCLEKRGV